MEKKIDSIEDYIELIKSLFIKEKYKEAIEEMNKCEEMIFDDIIAFKEKDNIEKSEKDGNYDHFNSFQIIKQIKSDEKLIFNCKDHYKHIVKNKPDRTYDGIDNWFHYEDNVENVTISGRVILPISIIQLAAIFKENNKLADCLTNIEKQKILKQVSENRHIGQVFLKMPLTVSNREFILEGFGEYCTKEKILMLYFKSPLKDEFDYPVTEGYIRMEMNFGFYFLKYIDDNKTELITCVNTNPHLKGIPNFVVNDIMKNNGYELLRDIREVAKNKEILKHIDELIETNDEYKKLKKELIV